MRISKNTINENKIYCQNKADLSWEGGGRCLYWKRPEMLVKKFELFSRGIKSKTGLDVAYSYISSIKKIFSKNRQPPRENSLLKPSKSYNNLIYFRQKSCRQWYLFLHFWFLLFCRFSFRNSHQLAIPVRLKDLAHHPSKHCKWYENLLVTP